MTAFRKRVSCPSSQALVALLGSRVRFEERDRIESHLATCDFCNAELQLLARHHTDTEEYTFVEMPAQLQRLAERFLPRAAQPFNILAQPQRQYHA